MQTIWNYLESAVIAVCLILIGVGALWAWGAWKGVGVMDKPEHVEYLLPVGNMGLRAGDAVDVKISAPVDPHAAIASRPVSRKVISNSVVGGHEEGRDWYQGHSNWERDTTGEAWEPVSKDVDLHSKALATLAELDRQVKAQTVTLEQARAEYATVLKTRKP